METQNPSAMISKSTLRSVATGLFVLLAALLAANIPAHSASGPWQRTDTVEGRLIAAVEGIGEGTGTLDRVPLGLHLKMKPGWKTYWRSPGDPACRRSFHGRAAATSRAPIFAGRPRTASLYSGSKPLDTTAKWSFRSPPSRLKQASRST